MNAQEVVDVSMFRMLSIMVAYSLGIGLTFASAVVAVVAIVQ